ncbi:uncharacterized protein METZ01_LOCUS287295, partial [marine metagenome]
MKNVKTLLILLSISTFIFASATRTDALGGAGFWADDYANIGAFPASVNNHNVAWTNGDDFTSVWNSDGTTWGFSGGMGNDDVVNMMWGNGSMGVTFGLGMSPEVVADATTTPATAAVDAETTYNIGFGMPLAGMDFGGTYDGSTIGVNLRRAQDIWLWDTMLIGFDTTPEDTDAGTLADMNFGVHCYSNNSYENGTNGLFALGFEYGAYGEEDAVMNLVWNFAVESAMTDWATLRVGYNKAHDFGGGANSGGAVVMGLGFNYGS